MAYKPIQNFKKGQDSGWDSNAHFMGNMDPFNFSGWADSNSDPYGGMPTAGQYQGMDPNDTQLAGLFSGPNDFMEKYVQEAMRNGLSSGTKLALNKNAQMTNQAREQARKMAGGQAANAEAALSMKGGMGEGARERIQKNAGNAALDFSNAADANAGANRTNLFIADEGARTNQLATASGMKQAKTMQDYKLKADDMARWQGEVDRRNAWNQNNYNQQMTAWGAGKQAQATADSGKK